MGYCNSGDPKCRNTHNIKVDKLCINSGHFFPSKTCENSVINEDNETHWGTRFFVQIFFDYDRPHVFLTDKWVRDRFDKFMKYTYQSLKNQTFKHFKILMLCGDRKKKLTDSLPWPDDCVICRDRGKSIYESIESDYVAIFRIDSDDMLHRYGMETIKNNLFFADFRREALIFRNNIQWHIAGKFIKPHRRVAPPFVTHIFPKKIYKDWDRFCKEHFLKHGQMGGRDPRTKELSSGMVCVVKHGKNISLIRRGLKQHIPTEAEKTREATEWEGDFYTDPEKIKDILSNFGIREV